MFCEVRDRWSAAVALTRYTRSAGAAMMLLAAYIRQLHRGEGIAFAWSVDEIGEEIGIKRRAILLARQALRRLNLLDWESPAGSPVVYTVNTERVAEILASCDVPASIPDLARVHSNAPASIPDLARVHQNAPASVSNPARVRRENTPASHSNPARVQSDTPANPADPARVADESTEAAPANPSDPAPISTQAEREAPARLVNPAPIRQPLLPPVPPLIPSTTSNSSFFCTYTRGASAGAANLESTDPQPPPLPESQETESQKHASAGAAPEDEGKTGEALLKRCGLRASQITAAIQRYTAEQINQAVDRVRALKRAGRCNNPAAFLAHLLKTGEWPSVSDTSAFDEPPAAVAIPPAPSKPIDPFEWLNSDSHLPASVLEARARRQALEERHASGQTGGLSAGLSGIIAARGTAVAPQVCHQ